MTNIASLCYIDSTGYHFPDYPTVLAYITNGYISIYGSDVYLGADSQDGQWIALLSQALYDTMAQGSSNYNSYSPVTSQGVGLSRNVKINGLSRLIPSFSTVTLTIVGTAGTVITNGVAYDVINQQWNLPTSVTIPSGGSIDVTATAAVIGLVSADANSITGIFTPTNGWQTVNNAAAANPGAAVESDAALRIRQAISTSIPAQTVLAATIGAVANVTGVSKVVGLENFTNSTDGNDLPAHSINITTVGGAAQDICNTIVDYKTPGTNPVGNTGPITCYDSQGMPLHIYYSVAVTAEIQVEVFITPGVGWSTNFEPFIAAAVAAAVNILPIGSTIYYSQFFVPALLLGTAMAGTYAVTDIQIGINGGGVGHSAITLDVGLQGSGAQNPVCNASEDVTFTVA